jgi:type VI secretion system protein VasJ
VLGHIKSVQAWNWAAYGKHPAAKDYFRIGDESHISKGFANWVDSGYRELGTKKKPGPDLVAWRFWARGAGKENMVCGVVRDSSDCIGRHYPLLIIGTGSLKDWEDRWDLLPLACDKPWGQIEYASSRMVHDLHTLGTEIRNIRPPYPEWAEFEAHRKGLVASMTASGNDDLNGLKTRASALSDKQEGFISLDHKTFPDQFTLISCWHLLLKTFNKSSPNAVFLGGTFGQSFMAFFNRSLQTADFINLWSIANAGVREDGSLVQRGIGSGL